MSSNLKVNTILPSTGTTIGIGTVGGLINVVGNIDVNSTSGISTFNGLEISGIVTAKAGAAVTYYGDGSNLTGITDNVVTINNNANNRIITGSGSANTLEAESNVLYDGTNFGIGKSPSRTLDVQGKIRSSDSVCFGDNSSTPSEGVAIHRPAASTLALVTNNTERLRINSVGNASLGLGGDAVPTSTAYNGGTLHIHQATSGSNGAQLKMTTAAGGSAAGDGFYIAHWGGNNETFIYNKEATNMRFGTNSAERLIIKNDGDLEITDGNLIVAPGHGIDFSDTAGTPSNGGELLDDYEEGNFTASLGGLSNWSSYSVTGQGHYVKIGKAVHININFGNVDLNNSASGSVIIFNLPFVPFVVNPDCRGVTSNYMAHKVQHANDGMIHSFYIHPTYGFKGQITKNNTSWTSWDASNFTATGVYLDFSATYFTAS